MSKSEITIEDLCEKMKRLWIDKTPPKLENLCSNVFCFKCDKNKTTVESPDSAKVKIDII